jgi:prepilin peptidase CpaA
MIENTFLLYSITIVFSAFLISAAVFDIWKFKIPNFISVGLFFLFFFASFVLPFQTDWISHLGSAGSVLVGGLILYQFRLLGAGDVKLMTAVSLWTGFENVVSFLLYTAIAGGAIALGLVLLRSIILTAQLQNSQIGLLSMPRILRYGESVPYALAILVGAGSQLYELPHLLFYL